MRSPLKSLLIRTLILVDLIMTLFNFSHLLIGLTPNTVMLSIRASTREVRKERCNPVHRK